jgi:homopolymeric O-antigen transport system permease protein
MSAQYHAPKVEATGLEVRAAFDIENAGGLSVGYQIFDPETDTLVVDGARVPIENSRQHLEMSFQLPPEPGRYRVFVSPMQEDVAWYYERGWRFLLIDTVVAAGRASIERSRITTQRTLTRERLRRTIRRIFTLPCLSIWRNRGLIRTMVRRDILGRYRGSFGGSFWTIINPLLLMGTYFFVFGVVLNKGEESRTDFALYFLAGMLPWLALSEAVGRSPHVILEHRTFVKKVVFPLETLPANLVISGVVAEAFALAIFVVGLLLAHRPVPWSVIWLPVLIVPQLLLTIGLSWFLAALGVFVRDLGQVIGFVLTLWFSLTPICYPEASLSPNALRILRWNPMYVLVTAYRAIFLEGHVPDLPALAMLTCFAMAIAILGFGWFHRLRRSFADII